MAVERPNYPEPVPAASQLAVLPFLSAVDGVLKAAAGSAKLRITMHRVMSRDGDGYLQQTSVYLGNGGDVYTQDRVGRMFTVDTGIMGRAFDKKTIYRTRHYATLQDLRKDLNQDLIEVKSTLKVEQVPVSYLAVPFIGAAGQVILVLYAECDVLNFFADNDRVELLVRMCEGFAGLLDWLSASQPFSAIRNFPLDIKNLKYAEPTVFRRLQEAVERTPPTLRSVTSFNYDSTTG